METEIKEEELEKVSGGHAKLAFPLYVIFKCRRCGWKQTELISSEARLNAAYRRKCPGCGIEALSIDGIKER